MFIMKHLLKSYSKKPKLCIESSVTLSQEKISLNFKITGTLKNYQFPQIDKLKRINRMSESFGLLILWGRVLIFMIGVGLFFSFF